MKTLLFPVTPQEFEEKVGLPPSRALPLVSPTSMGVYNSSPSFQTHTIPSVGDVEFFTFGGFRREEGLLLACVSRVDAPTPLHFYTLDVNPFNSGHLLDPQGYVCEIPLTCHAFQAPHNLILRDAFSYGAISTSILDSYPYLRRPHAARLVIPPFDPQLPITLACDIRDLDCKPRHEQIRAFLNLCHAFAYINAFQAPISEQDKGSLLQVLGALLPTWMFHLTNIALKDNSHPFALSNYGVRVCLDILFALCKARTHEDSPQ